MTYALEVVNGHLIAYFPGGPGLIDTGAPASITPSYEIQRLIGVKGSRIIGVDELNGKVLAFDAQARTLEFDPAWEGGESIPLGRLSGRLSGLPIISLGSNGDPKRAFLDTGAAYSYAPAAVVQAGRDKDVRWDFSPGIAPDLGQYEVETARITVQIGGRPVGLRAAAHPPVVRERVLANNLSEWIVGAELFIRGRVILDLRRDQLVLP